MASFLGNTAIMGTVLSMSTVPLPVRHQLDSFAGVNGRSSQRLGADGGRTDATLLITAPNPTARLAIEQAWINYQQFGAGATGTLIDYQGRTWTNVYVLHVEPLGDPHTQADGSVQVLRVVFEHLI
jgi:hypothetical protein